MTHARTCAALLVAAAAASSSLFGCRRFANDLSSSSTTQSSSVASHDVDSQSVRATTPAALLRAPTRELGDPKEDDQISGGAECITREGAPYVAAACSSTP